MADPGLSSTDADAVRSDERTSSVAAQDSEDDLVWWVLVDGNVFVEEPVADSTEAIVRHAHVVDMLAGRGVDRRRISLVQVGRAWGREHFTGS